MLSGGRLSIHTMQELYDRKSLTLNIENSDRIELDELKGRLETACRVTDRARGRKGRLIDMSALLYAWNVLNTSCDTD